MSATFWQRTLSDPQIEDGKGANKLGAPHPDRARGEKQPGMGGNSHERIACCRRAKTYRTVRARRTA